MTDNFNLNFINHSTFYCHITVADVYSNVIGKSSDINIGEYATYSIPRATPNLMAIVKNSNDSSNNTEFKIDIALTQVDDSIANIDIILIYDGEKNASYHVDKNGAILANTLANYDIYNIPSYVNPKSQWDSFNSGYLYEVLSDKYCKINNIDAVTYTEPVLIAYVSLTGKSENINDKSKFTNSCDDPNYMVTQTYSDNPSAGTKDPPNSGNSDNSDDNSNNTTSYTWLIIIVILFLIIIFALIFGLVGFKIYKKSKEQK